MEPSNGLLDRFRTAFKELVTPVVQDTTEQIHSTQDGTSVANQEDTESAPIYRLEEGRPTLDDGDVFEERDEDVDQLEGREEEDVKQDNKEEENQLDYKEEMNHSSGDEDSEFVIIEPPSPPPYIEQCIDICPVELMPLPEVTAQSPEAVGFKPSLGHIPSTQQPLSMSPSFFDRSLEFLRRELGYHQVYNRFRPYLSHAQWFDLFNSEGQMLEQDQFYQFLLNYEWPDELLQEGWKYLFGYYDLDSQHSERVVSERESEKQLQESLKLWQDLEGMEGSEGDRVRKLVYLINKDVHRTDRLVGKMSIVTDVHRTDIEPLLCFPVKTDSPSHTNIIPSPFRDNEENSDILRDLLVTYSFLNPDVGYVQGMNELLSMFLITIEDNVAAYWSYNSYLTRNKIFYSSDGLMRKLSKYNFEYLYLSFELIIKSNSVGGMI
eukprot:sb/3479384/